VTYGGNKQKQTNTNR